MHDPRLSFSPSKGSQKGPKSVRTQGIDRFMWGLIEPATKCPKPFYNIYIALANIVAQILLNPYMKRFDIISSLYTMNFCRTKETKTLLKWVPEQCCSSSSREQRWTYCKCCGAEANKEQIIWGRESMATGCKGQNTAKIK